MPVPPNAVIDHFGPHLAYTEGIRLDTSQEPDRIVQTHCCFCGQQCGIQLKVKDNTVIGFEPWYDFPFNEGKLCPKGVKRYLQGNHPDRLLHAYGRDPSAQGGFRPLAYDEAVQTVASEIQRIQTQYGPDAFALLSGASLTVEKAYLMGKFARVALRTANIDYNGRLCMVSAGAANKKAFGIDRAANPWNDILRRGGHLGFRRKHCGMCAHHNRLRMARTRSRRQNHCGRSPHHTRRPHLRPLSAGQAGPRCGVVQWHTAPDD